ncbi:MAG: insulinase family protein [Candidatus Parcubacteria bacterium]|nr:insulinase family protein [Candidatus Parcubacteria bacterium]
MKKQTYGAQAFSIVEGGKLLVAPTSAKDVVAVEGSVLGGSNHLPKRWDVIPSLSAELLDAGTNKKKKGVIRGALADRGISLSFSAGGDRTFFSGQCLPEDLPFLLSTIAECLGGAHFPEAEVKAAKARALGSIAELKTDTNMQARIALSRILYDTAHPNFSRTLEEEETSIRSSTRRNLLDFRHKFCRDGLVLAVTGDVNAGTVRKAAEKAFGKLPAKGFAPLAKQLNKKPSASAEKLIPIPDKANVDVLLGAALPLHKSDPLFYPAYLLAEMLGGGFASHLMMTIRERDGLTYGVYATLRGFDGATDGYLRIWATFSPEKYTESVAALRKEVRTFFSTSITEKALLKKKEEITGSYLVGLSTARGLARILHQFTIDGRDLAFLAEYPDYIRAVSLAHVRAAAKLVPLHKLSFAASGTFPKI